MKKYFFALLFCSGTIRASSQNNNSYTAFIRQDTSIKWAAECDKIVNLTPKIVNYSIKQLYLAKLKNGKADVYRLNEDKRSVSPVPKEVIKLERPGWLTGYTAKFIPGENNWVYFSQNDPEKIYHLSSIGNDTCCGCDEADAAMVKQILYYKNRRFYIQNVFLSPLCARKDTNDKSSWFPICLVAYNPDPDNNKPITTGKDFILIGSQELTYDFKPGTGDSILTNGTENIFRLLFDEIRAGKTKALDFNKGTAIPAKKFTNWNTPHYLVNVFDSLGDITGTREILTERNPDSISQMRIRQDWYFDFKHEKLYSRIKWIDLVEDVITSQGIKLGTTAFCRIKY